MLLITEHLFDKQNSTGIANHGKSQCSERLLCMNERGFEMQYYLQYPGACTTVWRVNTTKRRYRSAMFKVICLSLAAVLTFACFTAIATVLFIQGTIRLPVFLLLLAVALIAVILGIAGIGAMARPLSSEQTLFAKQGGFLYRSTSVSKYSFAGSVFLLIYSVVRIITLIQRSRDLWPLQAIAFIAIIFSLVFLLMGLQDSRQMAASVTDFNHLISRFFSRTMRICRVHQIIEKEQYYKVNCAFMRVKSNGRHLPQKTGSIFISKAYHDVETLMQELFALYAASAA